ncbi:MAG: capsule assembly Wzi family protein [Prevotella sp.]|nr:capsule assembly Wzi family protein [Prevotella sp.]
MRSYTLILLFVLANAMAFSQSFDNDEKGIIPLADGLEYKIEMQSTFSHGQTPLWLNANRYGLSSLENGNGYLRASIIRPLRTDSLRRWGIGYGIDLAVPYNFTSNFVIQQAFIEARWLHGSLSVGSKEYPMEFKNQKLSSGSQTLGINARPIPQIRLALPDYWALPFGKGWIRLKGHIAYGWMTDQNWQHDFTNKQSKYADNVLFHSKAIYFKIGNEERYFPFSLELGLEIASNFGGTSYVPNNEGGMDEIKCNTGLNAYWNAFIFGGFDARENVYRNMEGNQVGSWLLRMNWDEEYWRFSIYADKYFEDHSGMFLLDYDGYGSGDEWNSKKKMRFLLYDLKDIMLGAELNLKYPRWVNDVVFEYIYTKYQSGPIYHDHTSGISDHIGGRDNYYNHGIYTGWQHWGQVIGNPLFRSPIYNTDGTISIEDNRFMALHIGIDGNPTDNFSYRVLGTYQEGLGTYDVPYDKKHHNVSFLVEGKYAFDEGLLKGWSAKLGYAMDFGKILGNNYGFQITIVKIGHF